jgi:hypothetical protein
MPTVASLKSLIQAQIAPGDDVEFLRLLQEADIRLLAFGKWRWTRKRVTVTPINGFILLPSDCASILGAQVDGMARDIRDEQFEFSPDGVGDVDVQGERNTITVRLIDEGLTIEGNRHYKVTGQLESDTTIVLLCHKAPATLYDSDLGMVPGEDGVPDDASAETICPDVAALKLIMLGIRMEEQSDIAKSGQFFATALRSLDNKEKQFRGQSRQQFTIRPMGPGFRRVRSFR